MSGVNPEKFTDKTNEIVVAAQNLAVELSNVQLSPVHLMIALLQDADGLAGSIFKKVSIRC